MDTEGLQRADVCLVLDLGDECISRLHNSSWNVGGCLLKSADGSCCWILIKRAVVTEVKF